MVFKASETTSVLITADQVKSFMQMVWKENEKVGIGYKDLKLGTDERSLIALWFCKGTSSYDTHTDNVGKACMVAHDGATGAKYNECFNNYQLKEHNKLRYDHQSDAVTLQKELASKIEEKLALADT